ncbi:MAG: DUF6179 domain-containing protein [bacterium]|nr:DUF6179 domain-containing protein [bacterium]
MNNMIGKEEITRSEIDYNNYVESLILSLLKYNIINRSEFNFIIEKFLNLLFLKAQKYTGDLTSTIDIKVLKNINISNLYIIGLYLKEKSLKQSINILLNSDINSLYEKSKNYLISFINKTKLFYKITFLNNLISTPNYFYNSTLNSGIEAFFKNYNYEYDASNIIITVDYMPFIKDIKRVGIEFIKEYLRYINYENKFCKRFDDKNINILLNKVHKNYKDLPVNIFEYVFLTSILLKHQQKDPFKLNLLDINIFSLYEDYKMDKNEFITNLNLSYESLKNRLEFNKDEIIYFDKCFLIIRKLIINHISNNTLEVILGNERE